MNISPIKCSILAAALILSAGVAKAQQFPEKPVEMTILFGGAPQTVGQVLADQMSKALGSPVAAVSRLGGGGAIGYTYVKGQPADGYNIVFNSNSISTTHHQGNLPFDYKAFAPIARVGIDVPVVVVRKESGWTSLKDMIEAGKKADAKLKVTFAGIGSFTHVVAASLIQRTGIGAIYVPGGTGREIGELLAGRVDAAINFTSQVKAHVDAGKLVVLCKTTKEDIEIGLTVPTCDAAGAEGLDLVLWRGLAAPAETPPAVIEKLQEATKTAIDSAEFKEASANLGFTPAYLPAAPFGEIIAKDDVEISKLMKDLGSQLQK